MKQTFIIWIAVFLFLGIACMRTQNNGKEVKVQEDLDSLKHDAHVESDLQNKAMELKADWDSIKLHKIARQSDTITIHSGTYKRIQAEIVGPHLGNIRINQLIMPDKQSDGPFGKDINYELKASGDYQLIIGESLMQGDPSEGDYVLKYKGL